MLSRVRVSMRCLLVVSLLSLALPLVVADDPVAFTSHPELAHAPVTEHEFVPHTEMQAPGTVIHHMVVEEPSSHHDAQETSHDSHDAGHDGSHEVSHEQAASHEVGHTNGMPHHEGILMVKTPERSSAVLTCSPDEGFIHIIDSSFGQGQGTYHMDTGVIEKGHCHVPIDVERTGCLGKAQCHVLADAVSAVHQQDPCVGVAKRLLITYKCSHDAIPTHVAPVEQHHSPSVELHEFVPPPAFHLGGLGSPHAPPNMFNFFQHFFHNQQQTSFPFPQGEECEEDAHRLCGGILRNCAGDFGCTTQCITDHMPHLSQKCLAKHPCYADIEQFCKDVKGGSNEIMHCLKEHSHTLSQKCTMLHPCLLDSHCEAIDYDSADLQAHQPIFSHIPQYLQMLQHARANPPAPNSDGHVELPFMHLVLPAVVRNAAHHLSQFVDETIHPDHLQQQQQQQAEHHEGLDLSSGEEDEQYDLTDEDIDNEADPTFDVETLGTGHFSHIVLESHPDHAIDVNLRSNLPNDGFEVAVWGLRSTHNQLFDLNHFGQIFWIHAGADHTHYCLTAHAAHGNHIVSEKCLHESEDTGHSTPAALAQVWRFEHNRLFHVSTGKCLEVDRYDDSLRHGSPLILVDCNTLSISQKWVWETGAMAAGNPHIFDQHHQHVLQLRAQHAGASGPSHNVHDSSVTTLHSEVHAEAKQNAWEHEQLLQREHADYEREEKQIQHLEGEVSRLTAQEASEHTELEREKHELESERAVVHHQEEQLQHDEEQLQHLEHEVAEEKMHREAQAQLQTAEAINKAESEHFFTPFTLFLSVCFVGLLAYVFRIYLFPYFVKRYANKTPSHYYSHAY